MLRLLARPLPMRFLDAAPVTNLTRRTADGYLVGQVRCARTGVQTYLRKELGLDGPGTINLYRPETAVFDEASLRSYAGKPMTVGHPTEVNAKNWKQHSVGTLGSKVVRDGESVLVDFALMDADAIAAVESGLREVSVGYTTAIVIQDGMAPDGTPYGAMLAGPIEVNHLALVPKGRAGESFRIADGAAEEWGAAPIKQESAMSTKTVVIGDSAITIPVGDAALLENFKATMSKRLADAEAEVAKAKAEADEKDEEIGKLKAEKKVLEDAALTPDKLTKLVEGRAALVAVCKSLAPQMVTDGVSDEALREGVVKARLGDAATVGASAAEINGMFKALTANNVAPNDSARQALGAGIHQLADASANAWTDSIAARAGVKFKKGA